MTGSAFLAPSQKPDTAELWRVLMGVVGSANGYGDWQRLLSYTGVSDASSYVMTIDNQDTGGHLNVPNELQVASDGTGTTIRALTATALTVTNDLTVGGNIIDTGLAKRFKADFSNATLTNRFTFQTSTANSATAVGIMPAGNGAASFLSLFSSSDLTATGYLNVQMASTEARLTVGHVGASYLPLTFYTNNVEGMRLDASSRFLVGIATAPTATNDKAHVAGGRLYVSAGSEELALGLRYVSTAGSYYLGASNSATPDLSFKNNAGTQRARLLDGGGLIVGAVTTMGSELLLVKGGAQIEGLVTVTSGGIDITGTGTFQNAISVKGNTTLGDASSDTVTVNAAATFKDNLTGDTGTFVWKNSGNNRIEAGATGLGFFGASQVARPTVTGTRTGTLGQLQTVVANLLSALAAGSLGLITDSTS